MLESLFNKVPGLQASKFIEKGLQHNAYCEILKNIYFEKHLRTTASDYSFTLVIIYLFLAVSRDGSRTAATSKMELFVIIVKQLTVITKSSILDIAAVLDPPLVSLHYIYKKTFMIKKLRLCNPMTYVFKGHIKSVKICMVKFNVSILNRLKIMVFL